MKRIVKDSKSEVIFDCYDEIASYIKENMPTEIYARNTSKEQFSLIQYFNEIKTGKLFVHYLYHDFESYTSSFESFISMVDIDDNYIIEK